MKNSSVPAFTQLTAKVLLAVLGLFIGVVSTEVTLRLTLSLPGEVSGRWAENPGSQLRLASAPDQFEAIHRFNNLGFRGPEIALTTSYGNRIVCIGDSFTEGIGADEDETWPSVLREELANEDVEVINLGVSGTEPDRYLEVLAGVAVPLRPTHAIVCLNPPDLIGGPRIPPGLEPQSELMGTFFDRRRRIAKVVARGLPGWTCLWDRARGRWTPRTGLYWAEWDAEQTVVREQMAAEIALIDKVSMADARQLVSLRMSRVPPSCIQASAQGEYNSYLIRLFVCQGLNWATLSHVDDMAVEASVFREATRDWIEWYAEACRRNNILPIVVFFPNSGLVSEAPSGPVEDEYFKRRPGLIGDCSLSEVLEVLCRESGVDFVDCTPALRSYTGKDPLFLRYDVHPTSRAHAIVGKCVARAVAGR